MTNRYFKREWEEAYYIFDSEVITEKEVDEAIEYDHDIFADSMQGDEVIDRLNYYSHQLIEAGKLIEEGIELAREKQQLEMKLLKIQREFKERSILTEKEFLELMK